MFSISRVVLLLFFMMKMQFCSCAEDQPKGEEQPENEEQTNRRRSRFWKWSPEVVIQNFKLQTVHEALGRSTKDVIDPHSGYATELFFPTSDEASHLISHQDDRTKESDDETKNNFVPAHVRAFFMDPLQPSEKFQTGEGSGEIKCVFVQISLQLYSNKRTVTGPGKLEKCKTFSIKATDPPELAQKDPAKGENRCYAIQHRLLDVPASSAAAPHESVLAKKVMSRPFDIVPPQGFEGKSSDCPKEEDSSEVTQWRAYALGLTGKLDEVQDSGTTYRFICAMWWTPAMTCVLFAMFYYALLCLIATMKRYYPDSCAPVEAQNTLNPSEGGRRYLEDEQEEHLGTPTTGAAETHQQATVEDIPTGHDIV